VRNTSDVSQGTARSKWFRLASSITLAFALALFLVFIPVTVGRAVRVSVPALPPVASLGSTGHPGGTIDLFLHLGTQIVQATDGLTITKRATPTTVDQGGVITYTLVITNETGEALTSITVRDTVPENTECEGIVAPPQWLTTGAGNCAAERQAIWLLLPPSEIPSIGGFLADEGSVVLTYTVRVDQPLPNQSVITNPASSYVVTATLPSTYHDSGTADVTTTVKAPEWQISKSAVPTPSVQAGDFLTYTLTITNSGALTTSGTFAVLDTIPSDTAFDTATGSYDQAGDLITWTISTLLAPGQATTTSLVVHVDSPLTNGLTITNTGYQVYGGNVYTGALGPPVISTVRSQAQLEASKAANASNVEAGDLITYTLTLTNLGSATGPAEGVVVTDPLPLDVLYEDMDFVSPAAGAVEHPLAGNTGVVTWTLTSAIQPGDTAQVYVIGRVTSPLDNGTPITNTCAVTAANALAPAACVPLVNTVTSTSSLSLDKSVTPSANVSPGGMVTYTLVISNTGNETVTGLAITDTLSPAFNPSEVTWTDITVPGRPTYGTVGTQTLVFTATVPLIPGTYYNPAITATYASGEVTATDLAPITVGSPDLQIRKSVTPTNIIAGDVLTYTIVYSNASGAPATGVWITDTLGANLTFEGASPTMPDASGPPEYGWDVGTLSQADGEQTITIIARVAPDAPNATVVTNSVVITSAQGVGASYGPVNATVLAPDLHIVKSDAGYDPIDAGALLTYTITYSNTGDADAHNVRITDTLDANVSFAWASVSPDVSSSPPDYVWVIGSLPANSGPQTLTVAVTVTQPLTQGIELTNDVVIKGDEPFSDNDSITTTVQSAPVFEVSKTASPDPATPGEPLTYTIVFTNVGNATATGVRITDTLDSNVSLQSSTPPYTGTVGNQVYWDWPQDVTLDDPHTIIVTVLVTSALANGTPLWNTLEVDSSQGATATVTISTSVQSAPELHVTKTATPTVVQPGEMITYTITYSNTGTAPADVVISDTLDLNAVFFSATPPPDVLPPPSYAWNVAGLSPLSGTQVLTLVVRAASVLEDGAVLTNSVTIAGDGSSDSDTASTSIQSVDLSVIKSAIPVGDVQAGEWITYTITFSNTGGMDATGALITDILPVSLTNVVSNTSPGLSFIGGPPPYVWRDDSVAGGSAEVGVITITGQLLQTPWPGNGAELTNVVTISGDQAEAITGNNTFTVTSQGVPGAPYTVTVTPALAETTVGTDVPITVTVIDQYGNPVQDGTSVDFISLPVGSSVLPDPALTSDGTATATLSSVVSATVTISATAVSATGDAEVVFHPGPLHHFAIEVASPQTAGIAFSTVITALDQYGNIVDFDNTVTLTDTTSTLSPTSTPPLVSGQGTASVTVYTATPADVITATWGITPIIGISNAFEVLHGAPYTLTVTVNPTTIRVCETAAVTTTITDQWANPVPSQSVSLVQFPFPPPALVSLLPNSGPTDESGIFTSTLQGIISGTVQILGTRGSLNNFSTMPTVNINAPPMPTSLGLSVAPNPLYTGGATAVVTATVTDCFGSSEGQVVTFTLSNPSLAWFPGPPSIFTATTNASGVATATLTSNSTSTVGTLTITGTLEGLVDVTTLDVELAPTPSLTITKTANPTGGNVRTGQTLRYTLLAHNTGGAEATGVVISDTLPAGVGLVSASAVGGNINSFSPLNVVTGALPAGETITVTVEVTVTADISDTVLSNQASVYSTETGLAFSQMVLHRVITGTQGGVFLPIVLRNWDGTTPPTPTDANLRIIDIGFVGGAAPDEGQDYHVYVVVSNVGTETVTSNFWVDLYLNPVSIPAFNQPWQTLSQSGTQGVGNCPSDPACYGRAWFVTTNMAPGDVITLTTQMTADQRYDRWPTDGAPYAGRHSPIVALVDSWGTPLYGAIYENDETDNLSGSISGAGLVGRETDLDIPTLPPWPSGSTRPSLPVPYE
jgi:uncharacterized repeat protein (TIGR01451 family)